MIVMLLFSPDSNIAQTCNQKNLLVSTNPQTLHTEAYDKGLTTLKYEK